VADRMVRAFRKRCAARDWSTRRRRIVARFGCCTNQDDHPQSSGKPKGAVESLEAVAHLLPHAVKVLHGARHD